MITLLKSIVDTIKLLVDIISHMIMSFINLFASLPRYIEFLSIGIGYLPMVIVPFATASIAIYALYLVLNRNGG